MESFEVKATTSTVPPGRGGARRLDRPQVLEAAATVLREQGPQALTVRTVAERAQVSVQGVYTLFGGKSGLCEALFVQGFAHLQAALDAVGTTTDPTADVLAQAHAYRENALAGPGFYEIMFGRSIPEFAPSDGAAAGARATFTSLVEALTRTLHGAPMPQIQRAAETIWGLNHGLVSLELAGHMPGGEPGRQRLEQAVTALLAGWTLATPGVEGPAPSG